MVKLKLFEKSRVELEFVFSIFTTKSPETLWELRSIGASPRAVVSIKFSILISTRRMCTVTSQ
jgi:hypothetical protein